MPIVINEFEIIVEPPKDEARPAQASQMSDDSAAQQLRPEDIARINAHFRQRQERVRAD